MCLPAGYKDEPQDQLILQTHSHHPINYTRGSRVSLCIKLCGLWLLCWLPTGGEMHHICRYAADNVHVRLTALQGTNGPKNQTLY